MTPQEIISILVAIIGSGGVATIITALASRRKNNATADATNVKSILEIDARLNERITRLEERVTALEQENLLLKQNEIKLVHENEVLREENSELKVENNKLRNRSNLN